MRNDKEIDIFAFADRYLSPYHIVEKCDGQQIVPELCPFCQGGRHSDKRTFALSVTKGCYNCSRGSCSKEGRIEDLMRYLGDDPGTKRYSGAKVMNQSPKYQAPATKLCPITEQIYDFFQSRGISKATVDAYKIAADENGNIAFPFYMDGVYTYVKHRRPKTDLTEKESKYKEWQDPSTKPILFGIDNCIFTEPLYITEGQMDCMSLYEAGIHNAVSVPCGCDNLNWIETCYDWLENFNSIILFGDSDVPGRKMVEEVSKRLDESGCMIVREYPQGVFGNTLKDANEILMELGADAVKDTASKAEEIEIRGLFKLSQVETVDETQLPRIKTMIPSLDACTGGLMQGGLVVMTGNAGDGKSSLASQILLSAVEQGKTVCAYSGELDASRFQTITNLQAAGSDYIGLKYDPYMGKEVPFVPRNVVAKLKEWYGDKFILADNKALIGVDVEEGILNLFKMAKRRYNAQLFLLDNTMCITAASKDDENKAQQKLVNDLKQFAIKYNVSVILVSHPRKAKAGTSIGKDDISGTAMIVNLADTVIAVRRGSIDVIKNRWTGKLAKIQSVFCGDSRRVYEMSIGDKNKYSWDRSGVEPPAVRANSKEEYGIYLPQVDQPF